MELQNIRVERSPVLMEYMFVELSGSRRFETVSKLGIVIVGSERGCRTIIVVCLGIARRIKKICRHFAPITLIFYFECFKIIAHFLILHFKVKLSH